MHDACPRCGLLHPAGAPCLAVTLQTSRRDNLPQGALLAGHFGCEGNAGLAGLLNSAASGAAKKACGLRARSKRQGARKPEESCISELVHLRSPSVAPGPAAPALFWELGRSVPAPI